MPLATAIYFGRSPPQQFHLEEMPALCESIGLKYCSYSEVQNESQKHPTFTMITKQQLNQLQQSSAN